MSTTSKIRKNIFLLCMMAAACGLFQPNVLAFSGGKMANAEEGNMAGRSGSQVDETIVGKVLNEMGDPVDGVTVAVKGTDLITTTNDSGRFSLHHVRLPATLVFTGVSIETRHLTIKSKDAVIIKVKGKSGLLDEVVIAYGKTLRKLNTGSVAQVKAAEIERQPVSNPLLALQGKMPGFWVMQSSGLANTPVKVRIRGESSIGNGNDPLILVDGVPVPADLGYKASTVVPGGAIAFGSPLAFVGTGDIESITILKDADATAIYGARAANGVILITTKKGKEGPVHINGSLKTGISVVANKLPMMNREQYLDMRYEAFENDKVDTGTSLLAADVKIWPKTSDTDWQDVLLGGTANFTQGQVELIGGNREVRYRLGGTYQRTGNVFPGNGMLNNRKVVMKTNLDAGSDDRNFQVTFSSSFMIDRNRLPQQDITAIALALPPHSVLLDSSGNPIWPAGWVTNPYAELSKPQQANTFYLIGNAALTYKISSSLQVKWNLGGSLLTAKDAQQTPKLTLRPQDRENGARARIHHNQMYTVLTEPTIEYNARLFGGKCEAMVGATYQKVRNERELIIGEGIINDISINNIASAPKLKASQDMDEYKYGSVFGRFRYILKERYVLSLSGRRDGSSRFGARKRFAAFGAMAATWRFSDEKKVQQALPWLSEGKLRVSYGATGNDQIGNYAFLALYATPIGLPAYQGVMGLAATGLNNPEVGWERVRKLNLGIDLGFWNDRLQLAVDGYRNRSGNQLLQQPLSLATGFSSVMMNRLALVQNTGWEILLTSVNIRSKHFSWATTFNISFSKNKLLEFPGLDSSTYRNQLKIGRSINTIYVYNYAGIDTTKGIYKFYNRAGMETFSPVPDDRTGEVNLTPRYFGGFSSSLQYKGFTVDFHCSFARQTGPNFFTGFPLPGAMNNQPLYAMPAWQNNNSPAVVQKYAQKFFGEAFNVYNAMKESTGAYSDASYIRLKNIACSYRLPKQGWLQNIGVKSLTLLLQGQNLLTITRYKGLDPETLSFSSLPPMKVITAGLNATL